MSPEQIERFEAAVGELLDELGYPRVVPRAKNRNLEDAGRTRSLLMKYPDWSCMGNSSLDAIGGDIDKASYQI
jgi:hypothetical protein